MSNRSIGITVFIILAVVISAICFFICDFQKSKILVGDRIPRESAIVLKVNHPARLFRDLSETNQIWQSLDRGNLVHRLLSNFNKIDSIIKQHPEIYKALANNPLYIALAADSSNAVQTIFVQQFNVKLTPDKIQSLINESFSTASCTKLKDGLLFLKTEHDSLYMSLKSGVLSISDQRSTLAYTGHNNRDHAAMDSFIERNTNKSDAALFVNYDELAKISAPFNQNRGTEVLKLISYFAGWTETDIKIKKDEILFSGFSSVDSATFLAKFKGQMPLPNKVLNIIPFNTTFLFNQCFSDFSLYADNTVPEKYSNLSRQVGNEVALVNNATSGDELLQATYAVVMLSKGLSSQQAFIEFGNVSGSRFSEKQGAFSLYKINDSELLENLFGKLFSDITENWFSFIEDYIVFSNSKASLLNFIRLYNTGKTLDLNENFQKFSDNISTKSNVLIYCHPDALIPYAGGFVNNQFAEKLTSQKENINDIQGIAMQFSAGEELFYSSFYLKHDKSKKAENLSLWKVQLDDEAAGKPTLVWDHASKNYNVVVFDNMANMYLINAHGQIQWKKRIDSQPLSKISEIDYYKNGKIQYLFNTKDFIYLVDKNGDFVESYPIKISPSATNGLSLFDYKNNKDYRLLIAQADKKVYNYNIKGNSVFGWNKPKTKDIVAEEITRIVAGNKDYFIITDLSNNVYIVNRRGNERIQLKAHFAKARNSSYYENQTNSKGIIITTDDEGRLVYISSSGTLQFTEFAKFSPQHYFLYKDFKGDGVNEFIYLDGRELKVFDRFKKVLFSYEFKSAINQKPVIFDLGRKTKALGVVSSAEKTIYLFDQKGNTIINKGIVGETPFTVGSMNNDDELNLITAAGNILYNYRIK